MAVGQQVGLEDLHLQPKRDPHVGQPVLQRIIGQRQDLPLGETWAGRCQLPS
jgi:hypothetical protein